MSKVCPYFFKYTCIVSDNLTGKLASIPAPLGSCISQMLAISWHNEVQQKWIRTRTLRKVESLCPKTRTYSRGNVSLLARSGMREGRPKGPTQMPSLQSQRVCAC